MSDGMNYIPKHLQIEPTNGICSSRCTMCTFEDWTRKPHTMTNETFKRILEKFKPYTQAINYLTLHGCGEPLMDRQLIAKVALAKEMGFNGIGFATNCTHLNASTAKGLIKAGLDTVLCSIDGTRKETHEAIRVGTSFESVVNNVKDFIKIRNESGHTKVIVRFIRQELNKAEWPEFYEYWSAQVNPDFGDFVTKFDVHNWGSALEDYKGKDVNDELSIEKLVCQDLFERLWIFSDGHLGFCTADDNGFFDFGSVLEQDPIEMYNNETFNHYRQMMEKGCIAELEHCNNCTIPRSRALKET
ncbi:MAG: radical SAM/SPASM domain-containing protein [Pseudomonadota bacterium]